MIKLVFFFTAIHFFSSSFSMASEARGTFFSDLEKFEQQNPNTQSLKASAEAASDRRFSKSLFWTPTLELSAAKTRDAVKGTAPVESDYWQASASLNLFKGGKDWAQYQAARADERFQLEAIKEDEIKLEISASNLIFKSIYLREISKIQDDLTQIKEEALKIVKDRFAAGQISRQEVTKYEVDYSRQLSTRRLAQVAIDENNIAIKSAFVDGVTCETWPFSDDTNLNEPSVPKVPSIEKKTFQVESLEQSWKSTSRTFWPTLDVQVRYLESPINDRTTQETISSLVFTLPLWSRYETSAAKSSAYAGYVQAETELKNLVRQNSLNQNFLKKKIQVLILNLSEAKENLKKSKQLYSDMIRAFRIGKLTTNDLLTEQGRLIDGERNFLDSQLSFHQSLIELCASTGQTLKACID